MPAARVLAPAHRAAAVAAGLSLALHAVAILGLRLPAGGDSGTEAIVYEATLVEPAIVEAAIAPAPPPARAPAPRRRPAPRESAPRPGEVVAALPAAAATVQAEELPGDFLEEAPAPEVLALASPPAVLALPVEPAFSPGALPGEITIAYALTSVFADGEAEYTWKREGERYEITGTAQATGFFTLFLEGRIEQEASGRVTAEGLRPDRFTERRGSTPEEGLTFDWEGREVHFHRGGNRRTGSLTEATVDWLSMIFQLAHRPPRGDSVDLRVFTQRRLYRYRLEVVGHEELELPIGTVRTLHLRHTGASPEETVDVWLGVDHHHVPVKLRYPVARNRLVVEQTATSVRAR